MSQAPEGPPVAPPPVTEVKPAEISSDDRLWAMLAHLAILVFGIFGPLIILMVKKDTSPFVADQAKEALNFQLAILVVSLILGVTCVGLVLLPVVSIGGIVYGIIAGLEANKGVYYRYPYTIRMVS